MKITSLQFQDNGSIPEKYTCMGKNINPPIKIEDIPEKTKSLVLIVDDPDASSKDIWVHWVVYDIPVLSFIRENSVPGKQGLNDFKSLNYGGPCPSSGTHRYFFKVYALDIKFYFPEGKTKYEIELAMQGHVIAEAQLMGLYAIEANQLF